MKKILLIACSLASISPTLQANTGDEIATATAVSMTQSAVNTGMMVYWQGQGVQSNIVSLPNGTSYVVPQLNNEKTPSTPSGNGYDNQNNQSNKQAFMGSDN